MPVGISGPHGKDMKQSSKGSGGHRSRAHEAKDRPGGGVSLYSFRSSGFF